MYVSVRACSYSFFWEDFLDKVEQVLRDSLRLKVNMFLCSYLKIIIQNVYKFNESSRFLGVDVIYKYVF